MLMITNSLTILIVAFNWILKTLNFKLIKTIGYNYESEERMTIVTLVFYS